MSNYYFAIVFITIALMIASIIHLSENETLSRRINNRLILIATLIAIGATGEFLGLFFNGVSTYPKYVHGLIKAIEFSIAPIIPICYIKIVENRNFGKVKKILAGILIAFNAIFELVSIFVPFVFYIDENHVYRHGTFYPIYVMSYFSGLIIFVIVLIKNTKKYQSRNIMTLISLLLFLVLGFAIRIVDSSLYTDWLVSGITYLLFIIYYSDMSLKVDALTHLFNRKSYENRLKTIDYATAIIILDVNEFKQINDNYGHQCGDNVLKIIAQTILKTYGKYGNCYRIGGDEFCVILKENVLEEFENKSVSNDVTEMLNSLNDQLEKYLEEQSEKYPMLRSGIAKGYAIFKGRVNLSFDNDEKNPYGLASLKETFKLADERMYEDKRRTKKKNDSVSV